MKRLYQIGLGALGLLAIVKLLLLFWAVNKGIEMTDEGYYLLWFRSAGLYPPDMHLNYYYLIQMFVGWIEWDIVALRIGGNLTMLAAVATLIWGLKHYLKELLPAIFTMQTISLASLAGIAAIFLAENPHTLSYNTVTFFLMAVTTALLLYWIALKDKLSKYALWSLYTVISFVLMAQLLVKFSSAILMGGIWLVALVYHRRNVKVLPLLTSTVAGSAVFLLWFFTTQLDPKTFVEYFWISYERISGLGYTPARIFFGTYIAKDLPHFLMNLAPSMVVLVIGDLLINKKQRPNKSIAPVVVSLVIFAAQMLFVRLNYFPQLHYRFIDLVLWGMLTALFLLRRSQKLSISIIQLSLILGALPFVCAIGSAVNMPMSLFFYVHAWVMLVVILWQFIDTSKLTKVFSALFQFATIAASFGVFFWVFVWPQYLPHGFAAPLYQQTHKPLKSNSLLVDSLTAEFISGTDELLQKGDFEPNNYILALYDLPGLVYLMEGYSPQVIWYFGETTRETLDESVNNTCMHIANITEEHVYIIKPTKVDERVLSSLQNSKLGFPEQYTLQGIVYDPYNKRDMEVWSPNN